MCFVHTIAVGEVTALDHELLDDSVESRSFITKALFACAQSTEVLRGLGDCLPVEAYNNSTQCFISVRNIEIDLRAPVSWTATSDGGIELYLVGDLWSLGRRRSLRKEDE